MSRIQASLDFDHRIADWLEDDPDHAPGTVLGTVLAALPSIPQRRASRVPWRFQPMNRFALIGAAAATIAVVGLGGLLLASRPDGPATGSSPDLLPGTTPQTSPTATRTMESTPEPTFVVARPGDAPLEWSSDGTRLLVETSDGNLFVLHADGSNAQLTEQLSDLKAIPGSARPRGATISPDGTTVVFAGLTQEWMDGVNSCHNGAVFAVDADGGPATVLWESEVSGRGGIVRYPTFSPDGTQIAFVDDYCDHDHSVWVMNADGSDPHRIVSDPIGAGWVYGLAWSAAGERIALSSSGGVLTFATDGSDMRPIDSRDFCWPGRRC